MTDLGTEETETETEAEAPPTLIDAYFDARQEIFDHVGYVEDWRVLPLDDQTRHYWAVDRSEQDWCRWSPKRAALDHWVQTDEIRPEDGNHTYEGTIYTNRHLPRWVYRGEEFCLVCVDTQCDGNQLLMIFRTEREVKAA